MSSLPLEPPEKKSWRARLPLNLPLTIAVVALILAALLAFAYWRQTQRVRSHAHELAVYKNKFDLAVRDESQRAQQLQETLRQLSGKYAVLENKVAESQSQQQALEQMYQSLSRGQEDSTLFEVDQIIGMAAHQLQLAGNVNGAVNALQAADARLARDGSPRLMPIRRAVARDLERLRALPSVDTPGIALKLEQVMSQVDALPLLSEVDGETTPGPAEQAQAEKLARAQGEPLWWQRALDRLRHLGSEFVHDAGQLIRIRKVDTPEALLLAPPQTYFVRENLRLRLLNARFALLSRQESLFRADVRAAADILNRYFDSQARGTATALATLKSLESAAVAIDLPNLNDSIGALRSSRPARETR